MRNLDGVTLWLWAICILAVVIPVGAVILWIFFPTFGLASNHVTTQGTRPGYTLSCNESHRLVVDPAGESRAYIHCEPR